MRHSAPALNLAEELRVGFKPITLGFLFLEWRGSDFPLHTEQAGMLFPLYLSLRLRCTQPWDVGRKLTPSNVLPASPSEPICKSSKTRRKIKRKGKKKKEQAQKSAFSSCPQSFVTTGMQMLTEGYLGSCVTEGSGCTLRALGSQKRAVQTWLGSLAEMLDQGGEKRKASPLLFQLGTQATAKQSCHIHYFGLLSPPIPWLFPYVLWALLIATEEYYLPTNHFSFPLNGKYIFRASNIPTGTMVAKFEVNNNWKMPTTLLIFSCCRNISRNKWALFFFFPSTLSKR